MTSTVVITLKNSSLNDRDLLSPVISQTLREYLEFVGCGKAGNDAQEQFTSANGTEVFVSVVSSPVVDIPQTVHSCSKRPVDVGLARK